MVEIKPMPVIAVMILILVAFFIIFLLAARAGDVTQAFSRQQCRATVELASKSNLDFIGFESPIPVECSTRYVTIKYGDPKKNTGLKTNNPVYYVQDSKDLKKFFAEEFMDCWWQMGEGTKKPFISADNSRCIICSDIKIENDVVKDKNGRPRITVLDNFNQFMQTEKYPRTKQPYSDFYQPGIIWNDISIADKDGNPIPYSVTFFYAKQKRWKAAVSRVIGGTAAGCTLGAGTAVGCLIGGAFGTGWGIGTLIRGTDVVQAVFMTPFKGISTYCGQMF